MTSLSRETLLAQYDEELRRRAPYFDAAIRMETDGAVVRLLGATPDAGNNCVLYSALDEKTAAAAIDSQVDFFRRLGRDFEWKFHEHDRPASLRELLLSRGFVPEVDETIMSLSLTGERFSAAAPPGYQVRALAGDEGLEAVFEVQAGVWKGEDLGWLNASLARERAARPDAIRFHAAWSAGRPVCAGWTRLHGRFASLFGGSTLAEHRGRGLYRALLASRMDEARRRGAEYALVDAGPMSRPVLARLGFDPLTGTTPFVRRFGPPSK